MNTPPINKTQNPSFQDVKSFNLPESPQESRISKVALSAIVLLSIIFSPIVVPILLLGGFIYLVVNCCKCNKANANEEQVKINATATALLNNNSLTPPTLNKPAERKIIENEKKLFNSPQLEKAKNDNPCSPRAKILKEILLSFKPNLDGTVAVSMNDLSGKISLYCGVYLFADIQELAEKGNILWATKTRDTSWIVKIASSDAALSPEEDFAVWYKKCKEEDFCLFDCCSNLMLKNKGRSSPYQHSLREQLH